MAMLGALVAACAGTTTTATTYTPITGVLVRSDGLLTGIGCGTRDDQVFKYAAVVTQEVRPASRCAAAQRTIVSSSVNSGDAKPAP